MDSVEAAIISFTLNAKIMINLLLAWLSHCWGSYNSCNLRLRDKVPVVFHMNSNPKWAEERIRKGWEGKVTPPRGQWANRILNFQRERFRSFVFEHGILHIIGLGVDAETIKYSCKSKMSDGSQNIAYSTLSFSSSKNL